MHRACLAIGAVSLLPAGTYNDINRGTQSDPDTHLATSTYTWLLKKKKGQISPQKTPPTTLHKAVAPKKSKVQLRVERELGRKEKRSHVSRAGESISPPSKK